MKLTPLPPHGRVLTPRFCYRVIDEHFGDGPIGADGVPIRSDQAWSDVEDEAGDVVPGLRTRMNNIE